MRTLLLLLVTTSLFASGCKFFSKEQAKEEASDELKPVKVNGIYELSIPANMSKIEGLNADASLQYQSNENATCIMVVEEKIDDFIAYMEPEDDSLVQSILQRFYDLKIEQFKTEVTQFDLGTSQQVTINKLPAIQVEFTAKVEGLIVPLKYVLTIVQGDEYIYSIAGWTTEPNFGKHGQIFYKIADTFKEL